jgi:MSHA pilin protein MshD
MNSKLKREGGMTLIELVMSIVIIAIAVGGVLGLLAQTSGHSADAMIISQAVSIGEAYAEEIGLQSFDDPDGADGEAARADYDDVDDYDGLTDAGARDQFGNALPGLSGYTVSVSVQSSSALTGVASGDVHRIDVRVVNAPYVDLTLTRYRTRL